MKISYFFILFQFFCSFLFAQKTTSTTSMPDYNTDYIGNVYKNGMWIPGKVENNSISGSCYLFDNPNGIFSIINNTGNKFNLTNINYNIETKQLETKIANDSVFQYNLDEIDYLVVNKKKYKVFKGEMYQQLFSSNQFELLKSFSVVVQQASFNPLTQDVLTPKRYVVRYNYMLLKNNDTLQDFKLNKKSILGLNIDKKDLILNYVKANKLSYSNEDDVVKILNYLTNNN